MENDKEYFKSNTNKIPIAYQIFVRALSDYMLDRLRFNGKDKSNFEISCDVHAVCKTCHRLSRGCNCEESKLKM